MTVWQDLTYVAELLGDDTVGLLFKARVGKFDAEGIDVLRFNDAGLIGEITVMVRPLTALQALAEAMRTALSAQSSTPLPGATVLGETSPT